MFSHTEKQFILDLAKKSIESYLKNEKMLEIKETDVVGRQSKETQSCFVTLTIQDELRGCIGHTDPVQPLYLDVIENAIGAAFKDPRFNPLSPEELNQINIEVSVLSLPQAIIYTNSNDLLNKLRPNIDGVIIKKGKKSATYLPQVWEDLKSKEEFLSSLCEKAGLNENEWFEKKLKIYTYQVEKT